MNFKIFLLTSITTLTLSACTSLTQNNTQILDQNSHQVILENVVNIDVLPQTLLGNEATLIKEAKGFCTIKFTGFHHMGQVTEDWAFKGDHLISASSTKTIYKKPLNDGNFSSEQRPSKTLEPVPFDVTQADKIQNFTMLKSYFKKNLLEQCHK